MGITKPGSEGEQEKHQAPPPERDACSAFNAAIFLQPFFFSTRLRAELSKCKEYLLHRASSSSSSCNPVLPPFSWLQHLATPSQASRVILTQNSPSFPAYIPYSQALLCLLTREFSEQLSLPITIHFSFNYYFLSTYYTLPLCRTRGVQRQTKPVPDLFSFAGLWTSPPQSILNTNTSSIVTSLL